CLLLLLLLARGAGGTGSAGPWGGQRGTDEQWGRARYEAVKKQLGAVGAVSRQYWQYLAYKVWQEGCEQKEKEEESSPSQGKLLPFPGWGLPLVGQDYLEILSAWYCSFSKCCEMGDCRIVNNITGLEAELSGQLHGQHLAKEAVVRSLRGFLQSPRPGKPLVLSFHGWSGTGKNFVAQMVASHLYQDGLKSKCVRIFIALFHFPHHTYMNSYKAQLKKQISEIVQRCKQPLFIFDEAEKLHFSLLDAIKPFMAHYNNKDQVDYSRSIFLFLSNLGGNTINEVALDFWRAGQTREEMSMELLEQRLRQELQEPAENGYARSHLLQENLIDVLVPFLPLEHRHVKLCARDAFLAQGLSYSEAALQEVANMMVFVPKEEKLFSAQGCKSVSQRISYFLP
ncbi:TOR3A protein, partial [Urocolius indicus]|nr:TOR3A protein [Urocolius indicus]